ncbi:MAG TPA: DnaB-like helicase C-terminal domain-containing protein, partial [Gemmatimonadaceae bacterium]|nr:DnaB-like helicase C-terminal domain-containing protein [Gemmatimonadaceae bacterium]
EGSPPADAPVRILDAASYLEGLHAAGGAADTVSTGFPSVDALLGGGVRRGDLVVLGGDVGSGKSSLALAIALRAAEAGGSVALFSGECSAERLLERALAVQGRVRVDDLRHGRLDEGAYASVAAAALAMRSRAPLFAHLPPTGVAGLSDLLIEHLGLDLLVVDPVQSLARGVMPMDEEMAQAVRDLKGLAVRRDCAVLLVSHLADSVRERDDPRPRLADFGALGALRQLADTVLAVYREELYERSRDVDGAAELHVLKHRGGATGYADLYFYKHWLRFEDMVEPDR